MRLSNLKTKTAIGAKIPVFVICVEAILYLLLYNLHDCTFNFGNLNPLFNFNFNAGKKSVYGNESWSFNQIRWENCILKFGGFTGGKKKKTTSEVSHLYWDVLISEFFGLLSVTPETIFHLVFILLTFTMWLLVGNL